MAQKNPAPLPERDQVTVNVEMSISRDKISFLFGLNSNQLGSVIYERVRSQLGTSFEREKSAVLHLVPTTRASAHSAIRAHVCFALYALCPTWMRARMPR